MPQLTEAQNLEIFSANKAEIKKIYKDYIKLAKSAIADMYEDRRGYMQKHTDWNENWMLELLLKQVDENISYYQKQIKRWQFLIALCENRRGKPGNITDEDIARAKEVPIESLHRGKLRKVGKRLIGKCPFHAEKTASFNIYIDQNTWFCYGEGAGGSVVDYVMRSKDCVFLEAIKILLNKNI